MSFGYQVLGFGSGGGGIVAEFDYLIVAGGGGSIGSIGGGGGAGGFRTSFPGGSKIEVTGGDNITVGAGGTPTATTPAAASINCRWRCWWITTAGLMKAVKWLSSR